MFSMLKKIKLGCLSLNPHIQFCSGFKKIQAELHLRKVISWTFFTALTDKMLFIIIPHTGNSTS